MKARLTTGVHALRPLRSTFTLLALVFAPTMPSTPTPPAGAADNSVLLPPDCALSLPRVARQQASQML
jgi:hypothetical protein